MGTSQVSIFSPKRAPFSLPAPKRTCSSTCAPRAQTIRLTGIRTAQRHPDTLRRIVYFDAEKQSRLTFLSNNFSLLPLIIAHLYRRRWRVELFFPWIKQHLRIRAFQGTSENAVKTQVWVALAAYVLVAIAKKPLGLGRSLYQILEILSVTIFEKTPILQGLPGFNDQSPMPTQVSN